MAYVAIQTPQGDAGIGSAFHIGEGIFVTARHIVDGMRIMEIGTTRGPRATTYTLAQPPVYHQDPSVDVAVFKVKDAPDDLSWVPLGAHLDDWFGDEDFQLFDALLIGYPPIPLTNEPVLVAARAEINATVWIRGFHHPHFILSAMPRGGFSGGLALLSDDAALGVVTQGLLRDDLPEELGFMALLTIEPVYVALSAAKLLPECQKDTWDDLWNTSSTSIVIARSRGAASGRSTQMTISARGELFDSILEISAYDDGRRFYLEFSYSGDASPYSEVIRKAELTACAVLVSLGANREQHDRCVRITIVNSSVGASRQLQAARMAAIQVMTDAGFQDFQHF